MPIHFRCNYCDSKLSITRRKGGLQVQCPSCYKYIKVPAVADGVPTPAKVTPETVVPEKAPLIKAKENALESMNPDKILATPSKGMLSPPPPPVYFDEFDDDNPMFDVVQLTSSGQEFTGPIPWKKLLQSNKTILIIVITFVIGFLAGFVIHYLSKS
ncbi:MAG: hypothetical protein DWH70_05995 [Planctomycetota bacterium]|jgi:hypothetical protein|nr:MAG: hypothetical protein DWH70_05995 [Planctomycetota bacterium]